jgi:hypothetical protein
VTLRPYGWTWVGLDPFAWPTHHFGRWGFSAGAWFWIPGRTWGPAWVSWAYAPGYVSWCPLGWNNRAVIQINVFTRGYDPWRAWTVIPRRHFGVDYVNVRYVAGDRFDARVWRTFEPRYSAPASTGYAVPRSTAPIRVPGTVAPRRSPSTVYTNLAPGASRVPSDGRRIVIGEPRNSVAPLPAPEQRPREDSYAVRRGTPADLSRRSPAGAEADRPSIADEQRRALGIGGIPSRDDRSDDSSARRAVPRQTPIPSAPIYGNDRAVMPSAPRGIEPTPSYRTENPYGRRPPSNDAPNYGGMAVPRERPGVAGSGSESRPSGLPRRSPDGAEAGGFERRAPGANRPPQGPPPASPSGGGDRRGPGTDRGQPSPPPSSGGSGGHSRGGGQPTGGRAVPRGRG